MTALGYAALMGHHEIFNLKKIRSQGAPPYTRGLLAYLNRGAGLDVLKRWLEAGLDPNDLETGGSPAISRCIESMEWDTYRPTLSWELSMSRGADSERLRDRVKAVYLLVKHGAKWVPADNREIGSVRRALLKVAPDYAVEFVWILWKYKACNVESVRELLRTPSIKSHTSSHRARLEELLGRWGNVSFPMQPLDD